MEYLFNNLDGFSLQRLLNAILVARYGPDIRLTPLHGPDGGRDAETAPGNPYAEFRLSTSRPPGRILAPLREGRYLFQAKHHRTTDVPPQVARRAVLSDFEKELRNNVLSRSGDERVNYFFLVTNVPGSSDALQRLDEKRRTLLRNDLTLHADIWWQEQLTAYLDQLPSIWAAFPDLFPGRQVPFLAHLAADNNTGLPRAIRMAVGRQYRRDADVRFSQIDLKQNLFRLFVDLDVSIQHLKPEERTRHMRRMYERQREHMALAVPNVPRVGGYYPRDRQLISGLALLTDESDEGERSVSRRIILEGGPGQGKSTLTQMVAQIYRLLILQSDVRGIQTEGRWSLPTKARLAFRIELREFANDWLGSHLDGSVPEFLAHIIRRDSGGSTVSVDDVYSVVQSSPILLIFDGLDEVGSDDLRNDVLRKIAECVDQFESDLQADVRVIITTRPPAIAGHQEWIAEYKRFPVAHLTKQRIERYVTRWLDVQMPEKDDRERVRTSFEKRQREPHVDALAKNPMQLSVLLHFIRLKGEAFPDHRSELYRDYFQTVIDRDVEKSAQLREHRKTVEHLHQFLGFQIHALTEAERADGTLSHEQIVAMTGEWLRRQRRGLDIAGDLFRLGEERLGLIYTLRGEGHEARYGFEIQPVREYFAAAFVNEQIQGNAHEVFGEMVRRGYWHEVALFLAGLRRPNEKMDLIARARLLDKDRELGWRQDGRAITLQLMQEGVFAEPHHVFDSALDYLLDIMNPSEVKTQKEPSDYLSSLPFLVGLTEPKEHNERILSLVRQFHNSQDAYALYRLHYVARRVLPEAILNPELLAQNRSPSDLFAKIQLLWPLSWGIDISGLTLDHACWEALPSSVWARWWWKGVLVSGKGMELIAPPGLHAGLLEQFAYNRTHIIQHGALEHSTILGPTAPRWAIWRITNLVQMLSHCTILFRQAPSKQSAGYIPAHVERAYLDYLKDEGTGDFSGLNRNEAAVLREFIDVATKALTIMLDTKQNADVFLREVTPRLLHHLQRPGILGWVGFRFSVILVRATVSYIVRRNIPDSEISTNRFAGMDSQLRRLIYSFSQEEVGQKLVGELNAYYPAEAPRTVVDSSRTRHIVELLMGISYPVSRDVFPTPGAVRLGAGEPPVPLEELLSHHITEGDDLPFEWLNRAIYTTDIIRPLVERCKGAIPALLRFLSSLRFDDIGEGEPLKTPDVQRILGIVRKTDDKQTLVGAVVALSTSSFLKMAGAKLIARLAQADHTTEHIVDFFASLLAETEEEIISFSNRAILDELSGLILTSPGDYAFKVVSAAASYRASFIPLRLPPLLNEEERLRLHI